MSIHYMSTLPYPMQVGDTVSLPDVTWYCLVPCTVIGYTVADGSPVLGDITDPYPNTVELVAKAKNPDIQPGQTPTEARLLRKYCQVGPNDIEEIEGKTILKWEYDSFDSFVMLFSDNTYLKLELETGQDYEHPSLRMEKLDLGDLYSMKLVPQGMWTAYKEEKKRIREAHDEVDGARLLRQAIDTLGIERVKEMVDKTTPED